MAMPGIFQRRLDEPTLTTEAKFWPGGIPSFIKSPTENFNVEPYDFPPIVKGWYRFVRENWVLSDDETDDSKAQQRRSLIETWVTAQQDFRDSYTNKAPDPEQRFSQKEISNYGCYYHSKLVPWDLYLTADAPRPSTNWALWLKIQLMFYDYNRMWGHVAKETFTITPRENDFVTLDNIKRYQGLETADFGIVAFNNVGEAVYDSYHPSPIIVDDYALNTGMVLLILSYVNGVPYQGYRIRALNFFSLSLPIIGTGKRLKTLLEPYGQEQDPMDERIYFDDEALDMKKPLLEILLTESEEQEVDDDEVEDALIELAPGYVEAEAEGDGLAEGFDLFGSGFQSILLT
ncbi:uncharacterized protein N7484_002380 [Penicillium longicatenatum]|uniref:uncharacterized protein n=1 Tax=Penicillium longicatenatum TaxID=1561947 RepID=UPI0025479825|nr:uncharacterized protein N7484_002380 [Penicillium longicatenatum]KAJ5658731.1 hypothetical protein N7484_002380 [Penicillium longicatenatum]